MPITRERFEELVNQAEAKAMGRKRSPTMLIDIRHYRSIGTGDPVIGFAAVIDDETIADDARAFLQMLEPDQALDLAHRLIRAVKCGAAMERAGRRRTH